MRLRQNNRQLVIRLVKDQDQENYLLLLAEELTSSLLAVLEQSGLTPREAQILAGIVQGKNSSAIAQALQISPGTVRKHLEKIYRKESYSVLMMVGIFLIATGTALLHAEGT